MNLQQADLIVTEYLKKLYVFALRKTANLQDAEDLAQEIALKLYSSLLVCEIDNINAFIWRIAHNTLVNYYRGKARCSIGISLEEFDELPCDLADPADGLIEAETIAKLQQEIAYLSRMQRRIVILYYYEGRKLEEIAEILSVPVGTVKWHLFEARKEMKKGMERMRTISELKFNPIKFNLMGFSGSVGTMGGTSNFFRSILSQNIVYCVYREAKTINEIADCLGVSPVYVESEVDFLEEYGFLIKKGDKYLTNMIIDEPTDKSQEILSLQDEMYTNAARLISNELFDELMQSDLLNSDKIYYPDGDRNFLAWGLLLFLLAWGKEGQEVRISFEEAATVRKDGGKNIALAVLEDVNGPEPKYFDSMKKWYGPLWNGLANGQENILLWQVNSQWSDREVSLDDYSRDITRDLRLLYRFINGEHLSKDEYAFMIQKGYIKGVNGDFELAVIWLKNEEIRQKLLALTSRIRGKYQKELDPIKEKYCKAVLESKPKQVQKQQAYGLQYIFYSDCWFLLYTVKELLDNGRLKLPTQEQRISLSTVIMPNP